MIFAEGLRAPLGPNRHLHEASDRGPDPWVARRERTCREATLAARRHRPGGRMTTATTRASVDHEPELLGQTVVVIGGSAGILLESARRARREGARRRPHGP